MVKSLFSIIFLCSISIGSAVAINYLFKPNSFPIKQIMMVNKLNELDPVELQLLVSEQIKGGFFSLNIQHLREQIETLAWIDTVSVRKKWPDTIFLDIKEKKVSARWIVSNKYKYTINKLKQQKWNKKNLISDKAIIFKTPLTAEQQLKFSQLAVYSSPESSTQEGLDKCQKISQKMQPINLKLLRCYQDQRRTWFVELDNGFELYLGQQKNRDEMIHDNIINKTETFVSAYKTVFKKYETKIERIDMRYTNGFAIKWKIEEKES